MNGLFVHQLTCDYVQNPIGLDIRKPMLSWQLQSDARNVMQHSYRITVRKDAVDGDLVWDTGTVVSDQSLYHAYDGEPLEARTRYYWMVEVADQFGDKAISLETAFFETGIFCAEDWQAAFISAVESEEKTMDTSAPLLRKTFTVEKEIAQARAYVTALGLYELRINGKRVGEDYFTPGWTSYDKRLAYQTYDVTDLLAQGANAVGGVVGAGWFRGCCGCGTYPIKEDGTEDYFHDYARYGTRSALFLQLYITYTDGTQDIIVTDDSCAVRSIMAKFMMRISRRTDGIPRRTMTQIGIRSIRLLMT